MNGIIAEHERRAAEQKAKELEPPAKGNES